MILVVLVMMNYVKIFHAAADTAVWSSFLTEHFELIQLSVWEEKTICIEKKTNNSF